MSVVTEAGERLFSLFQSVVPLQGAGAGKSSAAPSLKNLETGLERFYAEARRQRTQFRLGVIGRARVALYLQQRLLGEGYPPSLVRHVLFAMLLSAFVG